MRVRVTQVFFDSGRLNVSDEVLVFNNTALDLGLGGAEGGGGISASNSLVDMARGVRVVSNAASGTGGGILLATNLYSTIEVRERGERQQVTSPVTDNRLRALRECVRERVCVRE